jgi:tetratricopeptide (TPR) repeat protein
VLNADSLFRALIVHNRDSLLATQRFDERFWSYHTRLFATLEQAERRYPEDPEVLMAAAEAGWQWGGIVGQPFEQTLALYDRAIALDSAFTPAYPHAAFMALALSDQARAVRYLQAHQRWGPSASVRGIVRLMEALLTSGTDARRRAERLLDSLPVYALSKAMGLLLMSADSGEAVVKVVRALDARNPEGRAMWTYALGLSLAARGHIQDMLQVARRAPGLLKWAAPFAALIPADTLRHYRDRWLGSASALDETPPPYWEWLASRGDTGVVLHVLRSSQRGSDDEAIARAYLALARHDTAEAVARFMAFPDSAIPLWSNTRLTKVRLLRAIGHLDEAARALRPTYSPWGSDYYPGDGFWHLERGRTWERLGDTAQALRGYQTVVDLWRRADPELQPFVTEARHALIRLGSRSPQPAPR